jgi:putative transposase
MYDNVRHAPVRCKLPPEVAERPGGDAGDLEGAVSYLAGRPDPVDTARIGVIGQSQGNWIIGAELDEWAYRNGVQLAFIDPGKPTQNAFIERFNGTCREECLNENWFVSLADAQQTIEAWRVEYNPERPHSKLRDCTPREFALNLTSTAVTTINPTGLT